MFTAVAGNKGVGIGANPVRRVRFVVIRSMIIPNLTKTFANGRAGIKMFGCLNRLVAK